MKPSRRQQPALNALDLVEEATQVLRSAPASALVCYYIGSLPFILDLLYFWADMSHNPFAREHVVEASLGLALLFLWMKFWQTVFARQIHALVAMEPAPAWNLSRIGRVWVTQSLIQPWGLFLLPLALVSLLPFPTVYSFFQNTTVLDDGEPQPTRSLIKKSGRLALLWPGQCTLAILIVLAFVIVVLLNWSIFCYSLPRLLNSLLGIQSEITRSGASLLNSTFFATMFALTYLCMDPLVKTLFVLRCFYGESLHSGEDLKTRLKQFASPAKVIAGVLLALSLAFAGVNSLHAAAPPPATNAPTASPTSPTSVAPEDLDRSINEVIHQDKYVWRMPREQTDDATDQGFIAKFLAQIRAMVHRWIEDIWTWIKNILKKIFPTGFDAAPGSSMLSAMTPLQILVFILLAVVACVLVVFLLRYLANRRRAKKVIHSTPIQSVPDLTDENTGADQLPEDGWMKLARELIDRGDYRLALRAFYLAGLAHLAARNLISLAKFKSNRDYECELRRRGHAFPDLPPAFGEIVATFDKVWYGLHEANSELVGQFNTQVEKLRAHQ